MTKHIRVENADTSAYKVEVQMWDKGVDGASDVLVTTERLDYPTAMTSNLIYLTSTRYVIVKKVDA